MTKQAISNISTNSYDSKGSSYEIMPWFVDKQSHWIPPSASTTAKAMLEHSRTVGKEEFNGEVYQHLQPACRLGRYLPYGEQFVAQKISDWSTRYKFTGHERDIEIKPIGADSPNTIEINYEMRQTGFDYAHARYYNSDFSIFMSVDPLASKYPGISGYAYCYNNPIIYTDPMGLEPKDNGRYGLFKRFGNWVKGDSWKNKVNKFQVQTESYGYTENEDGSITLVNGTTKQDEAGEFTLTETKYRFSKDGVTKTTTDSYIQKTKTKSYNWEGFYQDYQTLTGNALVFGGLGITALIKDGAKVALKNISNFAIKTVGDIYASKVLQKALTVTKSLGVVTLAANTIINAVQVAEHWNSPDRGYYIAKAVTSTVIAATSFIPIAGTVISITAASIEAGGGFDKVYNRFK